MHYILYICLLFVSMPFLHAYTQIGYDTAIVIDHGDFNNNIYMRCTLFDVSMDINGVKLFWTNAQGSYWLQLYTISTDNTFVGILEKPIENTPLIKYDWQLIDIPTLSIREPVYVCIGNPDNTLSIGMSSVSPTKVTSFYLPQHYGLNTNAMKPEFSKTYMIRLLGIQETFTLERKNGYIIARGLIPSSIQNAILEILDTQGNIIQTIPVQDEYEVHIDALDNEQVQLRLQDQIVSSPLRGNIVADIPKQSLSMFIIIIIIIFVCTFILWHIFKLRIPLVY